MKAIAINGSPRKDGNTAILLNYVLDVLKEKGVETEHLQFAGKNIAGCKACRKCFENKDRKCIFTKDILNDYAQKMIEADAIILGSPTYYTDVTSEMKALIDRAGSIARANGLLFKRKIGAAVTAVRRGGAMHTIDSINHFFYIQQMIIPGSTYWNMGFGGEKGEVKKDEEGIANMKNLGENIFWLLNKINN